MTGDLRAKFNALNDELNHAFNEFTIGKKAGDWKLASEGTRKMTSDALKSKIDEIEKAVQKRLHFEEDPPAPQQT